MKNERNKYIDIVKCIAIFLVVLGHCIQYGSGKLYIQNELFFDNIIFKIIYSFHMPLLMLISGYLYWNTILKKTGNEILKSKVKSLLLPIFIWITVIFIIKAIKQLITNEFQFNFFFKDYLYSLVLDIWFLKALFIFDIIVLINNKYFKDNIFIYFLIALFSFILPDKYAINTYCFTYPFFMIGYFYNKYKNTLELKNDKYVIYRI